MTIMSSMKMKKIGEKRYVLPSIRRNKKSKSYFVIGPQGYFWALDTQLKTSPNMPDTESCFPITFTTTTSWHFRQHSLLYRGDKVLCRLAYPYSQSVHCFEDAKCEFHIFFVFLRVKFSVALARRKILRHESRAKTEICTQVSDIVPHREAKHVHLNIALNTAKHDSNFCPNSVDLACFYVKLLYKAKDYRALESQCACTFLIVNPTVPGT
ncbi:hypothetical protein QVD17_38569 [Tagetes erecta]|uniref:Uncharacterized protein n=1 Tax=Tagetes erecta TaxID=13708 RepID=A0AAD8JM44_TARER|nr:hypothetical protein QVD17_38569 [Tagetes erecta]